MSQRNPYEAPDAAGETNAVANINAPDVASGQKLVVYACMVYLAAGGLQPSVGPAASLLALPALVMALIGVFQVVTGLSWSPLAKAFTLVLMFVPLINLITLLVVNSKATSALRNAGYRVGFLGASR